MLESKGGSVSVRQIKPDDAEAFLALCKRLDNETKLMMLEPDERTLSVPEQRSKIANLAENEMVFVAVEGETLIGFLACYGYQPRRKRHCAYLVIGILQAYTGQGIGTTLFESAEVWAQTRGITRLELTVMTHNRAGLALYHKRGFVVEGLLRNSLKVDGRYVHEYMVAKLL